MYGINPKHILYLVKNCFRTILFRNDDNTKTAAKSPVEEAEQRSQGLVGTSVYWKYFRAGNSWILLWNFFVFIWLTQLALSGSDYWLKVW